jgi:GTP-binding protein
MPPKVAIIGRPNVGKSTLFNRLVGKRLALVDDQPGVTRDRRYAEASLADLDFTLIDTAGMEQANAGALESRMLQQTREAIREADIVLFLVDVRAGVTPIDEHFAREVRIGGKPMVLVANKAEGRAAQMAMGDIYALGFEHTAFISAEHGEGLGELYDALSMFMQGSTPLPKRVRKKIAREETEDSEEEEHSNRPISIAIVGRPNAGKSTLINALIGEDRLLVGPEAGITRDSISLPFEFKGRALKLVDTAGIRKRAKVQEKLEKLSVADSLRAVQYAEIVVVLLDATAPLEKQDATIAALVEREGRACIIGLNKWDLVKTKRKEYLEELCLLLGEHLAQLESVSLVPCSALKAEGLNELLDAALATHAVWNKRVATAGLNRWLEDMLARHSPPLVRGRRIKIKYITQIKTRPPTFQLHCNMEKEFPDAYLRYLVRGLRENFDLPGVPIRMQLKVSNNPFVKKD